MRIGSQNHWIESLRRANDLVHSTRIFDGNHKRAILIIHPDDPKISVNANVPSSDSSGAMQSTNDLLRIRERVP